MQFPNRTLVATALLALSCGAHAADDISGYLLDSARQPVRSASGACVHTRSWQRGMHFADCEPQPQVAAAQPAPKPEPMVEAPKPAPVPQAVPFRLSIDSLFDYDSTALKPEGREVLDYLASRIANADYQSVTVTGHADPLGTPSYNRALSERRARAIADYLAGRGIDAGKISVASAGSEGATVTLAGCKARRRAALIECLQPDRHAEVTVTGTVQQAASTGETK
jgi:OOP family OmpA-OmpF porin